MITFAKVEIVVPEGVEVRPVLFFDQGTFFPDDDVSGKDLALWLRSICWLIAIDGQLVLFAVGEDVVLNDIAIAIEVAAVAAGSRVVHDVVLDEDSAAAIVEDDSFARAFPALAAIDMVDIVVPYHRARRSAQRVDRAVRSEDAGTDMMTMVELDDIVTCPPEWEIRPPPAHGNRPHKGARYFVVTDSVATALSDPDARRSQVDLGPIEEPVV